MPDPVDHQSTTDTSATPGRPAACNLACPKHHGLLRIAGSSPHGQGITLNVFKIPGGTPFSAVATAAVFGFLSFAGFEGAASLGEETDNPRREIPRAIRNAVIGSGIFYILCILVQTWGFGANAAGAKAFSSSAAPLGDLAHSYVGSSMEDLINFGATISAFGGVPRAKSARSSSNPAAPPPESPKSPMISSSMPSKIHATRGSAASGMRRS